MDIGLSYDSPLTTNKKQLKPYSTCKNYRGPPRVILDLMCDGGYKDKLGRHVIIQLKGSEKQLGLCEVQVFGFIPGTALLLYSIP